VPVVSYVPEGRLAEARRSFEKTPEMIGFYSELTGYRYPWPGYAQICVDRYLAGGMEHTGATTLTTGTLHDARAHLDHQSDGLVSHELIHQWYGDLITCKDFGELWLNESFATYFATLWIEHDRGADEGLWRRHGEAESYFGEDRDRYRRPIVTYGYEHPRDMFDRHSYPKGARVLHMLRFVLGEERFWTAIRHYTRKHAFGTVETADLRIAIEESTGQGLNWFFRQWLDHGGHPEYEVRYDWDQAEKMLRLEVKQTQEVDELTPLFRMPVEIELVLPGETLIRRVEVSKREETFHFSLPERPRWVCFDPRDWVLKKLTSHKSKQEWLAQLAEDEHVMCRVRAVHALAEMTKDGDAEAALVRAARDDPFWAVRGEAAEALSKFRGDDVRATLLRLARDDPKSDVRRAAVESLGRFSEGEIAKALREVIRKDPSYETVAAALRSLVKVDKDGCRRDLTAALQRASHHEVIGRAAADGLADVGDAKVLKRLLAILGSDEPIGRRAAVLGAVAKLGEGRAEVTEALAPYLDDPRRWVYRPAIEALGATGDPAAIDVLLKRRDVETSRSTQRMIDKAVEKLRERTVPVEEIRRQVDELKQENRRLRERVEKLEREERR
jgi:aminopeptidase N